MQRHPEPPDADPGDSASVWELTQNVCAGDEPAFFRLYDRYVDRLFRYLLVIAPRREDLVRDSLQETMLRVARHLKPIRDERILWGWLCRVGKNALIDGLRKEQRRSRHERLLEVPDEQVVPGEAEAESKLLEALRRSVADMNLASQRLIDAYYVRGLTHAEIADELGTTSKAVESRLARLRARLRPRILEMLDDRP